MITGGYLIVDMSGITVTGASSANIQVKAPKNVIDKLQSWGKPVMITNLDATVNGTIVRFEGFTSHMRMAGVHHHSLTSCDISVVGSDTLQIIIET